MRQSKILIVGRDLEQHLGSHLYLSAQDLPISTSLFDIAPAYDVPRILLSLSWRLRGKRPPLLGKVSQQLYEYCLEHRPDYVLVTGITLPSEKILKAIKALGIVCINWLTDDPWNDVHFAPWFMKALPNYDFVFTPRMSNFEQLKQIVPQVYYLPFGYIPDRHYKAIPSPENAAEYVCDVMFYGGADEDRIPYIRAILDAGIDLHLYGPYWERYSIPQSALKGYADAQVLRYAVSSARISLCLVRHANRDGHVMRTFEVPAMGGCMLIEDTDEHCAIFGDSGAVAYFSDIGDMVSRIKHLLSHEQERRAIQETGYRFVHEKAHTYADRLQTILSTVESL